MLTASEINGALVYPHDVPEERPQTDKTFRLNTLGICLKQHFLVWIASMANSRYVLDQSHGRCLSR